MTGLRRALAYLGLGLLCACPTARAPDATGDPSAGGGEPAARAPAELPWWLGGSYPYRDAETGLALVVPDGWAVRSGRGELLLEARGPAGSGLHIEVRRWDGDPGSLDLDSEDPTAWMTDGPYLSQVIGLDREVLVSTHEAKIEPPSLRLGWHLAAGGAGVSIRALIPRDTLEEGLKAVRGIVDSVRLEGTDG